MQNCDFKKFVLQLYRNHTFAWLLSCTFAALCRTPAYLQNTFLEEHLYGTAFVKRLFGIFNTNWV